LLKWTKVHLERASAAFDKGAPSKESTIKELSRQFWGRHIWGRGYFAASSGNVTDEVIMEYIATQDVQENDGDFHITP